MGELEWDTLADAAVSGDSAAVGRLLGAVRPIVVRYCRARLGRQPRDFAVADRVARNVCVAVLAALPGYRSEGRPFLAFVYRTATHQVTEAGALEPQAQPAVVRIPRQTEVPRHATTDEPTDPVPRRMHGLIDVLPGHQRDVVLLRLVVGLSVAETAAAVGSTPGAVRAVQHRALAELRRALSVEEVC